MLFDSHAHLNEKSLTEEERQASIDAIEKSSLDYVMDIGFDLESSKIAIDHAVKYPWCYAVVGCHPQDSAWMICSFH